MRCHIEFVGFHELDVTRYSILNGSCAGRARVARVESSAGFRVRAGK